MCFLMTHMQDEMPQNVAFQQGLVVLSNKHANSLNEVNT